MIYPTPPVRSLKDLIEYCTQSEEDSGIVFVCDCTKIEGRNVWTIWTSYLNEVKQFSFIKLFKVYQNENGWGYEQFGYEAEFEDQFKCPRSFLEKTQESPFIHQEWRNSVLEFHENLIPKDWEQCKKLFRKLSAGNTGERLRVHFTGLKTRFTGMEIPYADIEDTSPFLGRYKGKLYKLKRSAISGYEILPKPKHPRGHIES